MAVRCLIVDDNRAFLEAARTLLEREGLTIAGVASASADALRQAETLRPDVVLVDVSLGARAASSSRGASSPTTFAQLRRS
jgi:CheY-like chemotaxis protein